MFVVYSKPVADSQTFKVFEQMPQAQAHAQSMVDKHEAETAEIWEVAIPSGTPPERRYPAALAALKMGEGSLVGWKGIKASTKQIEEHDHQQRWAEVLESLGISGKKDQD